MLTTWSDGVLTVENLVRTALEKGFHTIAVTDHSAYMGITGGIKPETLAAQHEEIEKARGNFGKEINILHGVEVDITADGGLALPDESLAQLDFVIASLHVSLRQPREVVTNRLLNAIRNPHVDAIGHPSGRLLPTREGADLDFDSVLEEALKHGVALEINASPMRLDLNDVYTRRAVEMGIPILINTDAHSRADFDLLPYGVSVARRAWAGPEAVINTWPREKISAWLNTRNKTG